MQAVSVESNFTCFHSRLFPQQLCVGLSLTGHAITNVCLSDGLMKCSHSATECPWRRWLPHGPSPSHLRAKKWSTLIPSEETPSVPLQDWLSSRYELSYPYGDACQAQHLPEPRTGDSATISSEQLYISCKMSRQVLGEERLQEHARAAGKYLRSRLVELQERHMLIGDIRGMTTIG